MFSPPSNRTPIAPVRTPLRKERGVKVTHHLRIVCCYSNSQVLLTPSLVFQLLDISELDMVGAGREAKRRRKTLGNDLSQLSAGVQKGIVCRMFNIFSFLRNRDRRENCQRRGGGGKHHPRLRCWPRLHTGTRRASPFVTAALRSH